MRVTLNNLSKKYGENNLLQNVNLEFFSGYLNVIYGKSGSGKSTLLNMIAGLEYPDKGAIFVDKSELKFGNERWLQEYRRNNVGFIFQDFNLDLTLTTLQNVLVIGNLKKNSAKILEEKARHLLKTLGLSQQMDTIVGKLSGGQKQRCAIARVLINDPDIILADEPTGNLDMATSKEIAEILKEIAKEKLVIVVSHGEMFREYADKVYRFNDEKSIDVELMNFLPREDFENYNFKKGEPAHVSTLKTVWLNLGSRKFVNFLLGVITFISTISLILGFNVKQVYEDAAGVIINEENQNVRILDVANPLDPNGTGDPNNFQYLTLTEEQQQDILSFENVEDIKIEYSYFHVTKAKQEEIQRLSQGFGSDFDLKITELNHNYSVEFNGHTYTESDVPIEVAMIPFSSAVEFSGKELSEIVGNPNFSHGEFISDDSLEKVNISEELAEMLSDKESFKSLLGQKIIFYFNVPINSEKQIIKVVAEEGKTKELPMLLPIYKRVPVALVISGIYQKENRGKFETTATLKEVMISSELVANLIANNKKTTGRIGNIPSSYNHIIVNSYDNVSNVIDELKTKYPQLNIRGYRSVSMAITESIQTTATLLLFVGLIGSLLVIVILFIVAYTNYLNRKRQYGVYKAFGANGKQLFLLTSGELFFVMVIGYLLGIFFAVIARTKISQIIFSGDEALVDLFNISATSVWLVLGILIVLFGSICSIFTHKIIKTKTINLLK